MEKVLINNHNSVVKANDIVIHAGDLTLGRKEVAVRYIKQLNGNHIFLKGSHDRWLSGKALQIWGKMIDGQYVVVCHYAMKTWDRKHYGSIQLFAHCFSDDTELLTKEGFIKYNNIKIGQEALTLNTITNMLEYNIIKNKFVYDNVREMVRFKNRSGDILVTTEHTILRKNATKNAKIKLLKSSAKDSIKKNYLVIPVNAQSNGKDLNVDLNFLKLLGLIISDGHFHKDEHKYSGNGVSIYQKSENYSYIKSILDLCKVPYTEHRKTLKKVKMVQSYIPAEWVKNNIYPFISSKRIPQKLMSLRDRQFRAFLGGLIFGDGYVITRKLKYSKIDFCNDLVDRYPEKSVCIYYTGDKLLKDELSHLCTLNGLSANSFFRVGGFKNNGSWYIIISNRNYVGFRDCLREIVPYSGKVWCVNVDNETLVTRRGGFIFITGNSHGNLILTPEEAMCQYDIGVDNSNFFPNSFEQIREILGI